MDIKTVVTPHYNSNSYIIIIDTKCVIVDINLETINYVKEYNLEPIYLFLTHEHLDHIKGTSQIKKLYSDINIISSKVTAENIKDNRENLSLYFDGVGFEEDGVDIFIEDENEFIFKDRLIKTYNTPGHSEGSIVINIDNLLFTGDTVLDVKTPVNFPHSSKIKLKESIDFIDENFSDDTIFYQGHGKPFLKKDWDKLKSLYNKI